jgi:hypothetical protein
MLLTATLQDWFSTPHTCQMARYSAGPPKPGSALRHAEVPEEAMRGWALTHLQTEVLAAGSGYLELKEERRRLRTAHRGPFAVAMTRRWALLEGF